MAVRSGRGPSEKARIGPSGHNLDLGVYMIITLPKVLPCSAIWIAVLSSGGRPSPLEWKAKQRARFDHWLPHYREGMLADDQRSQWLASDEDREEALRALRQALVDGRITAQQHSERVSKVLAAQY